MNLYEDADKKRIKEKKKFNGMRLAEADNKLRSNLLQALGSEFKSVIAQKPSGENFSHIIY